MLLSRKFLYLSFLFLLPVFSCNKVKEILAETLSPEIKIGQEFEFVFKEYAKQKAKEFKPDFDTANLNIDNLPPELYIPLQQFVNLDTIGLDSFEIDRVEYVYKYALTDLDINLRNNPGNVLNFTRADIHSAKVDSARLYMRELSPINQQDFNNVRIDASNKNVPPLSIVNASSGFNFESVQEGDYRKMMRLPVINPNEEYRQYMIPPNDSVTYTFKVQFKNPIKFALDDKYKLAFNYKFVFKK
jgi:hypothetical protein